MREKITAIISKYEHESLALPTGYIADDIIALFNEQESDLEVVWPSDPHDINSLSGVKPLTIPEALEVGKKAIEAIYGNGLCKENDGCCECDLLWEVLTHNGGQVRVKEK